MNTYKVWITGAYKVAAFVNANSPAEAEKQVEELTIEQVEDLIYTQGIDWGWKVASEALPECKVGYIAQAAGDVHHRFFESKYALLRHLDERQRELYLGAVKWEELFDFFLARNYFRVV
jgi:hypothetical protein